MNTFPNSLSSFLQDEGLDPELRNRIIEWANSRLFHNFLNQNRQKIINKLKSGSDVEDKRDVGIELYVAYIFCDSNCEVIYEPKVQLRKRPDFKILFDNHSFFCEVKRVRRWGGDISEEQMYKKCGDIIFEMSNQTVPGAVNIAYIRASIFGPNLWNFKNAVKNIFEWMQEDKDTFLVKANGYSINSIDEFNEQWSQCTAFIIPGRQGPTIWENPDASIKLSPVIKSRIEDAINKPFRDDPLFDE